MGKPGLLALARAAITDGYVVDVRKGPNGSFTVATAIDSPAELRSGRYVLIPAPDAALAVKRIHAVEHADLLKKAAGNLNRRR